MEPFRVLARLRPVGGRPLPDGVGGGSLGPCAFPDPATDNGVRLVPRLPAHALNGSPETVGVDAVLPQTATQAAVFARVFGCGADGAGAASDSGHDGSAALCRLVDGGINVTLLAYGATGAWGWGAGGLGACGVLAPPRACAQGRVRRTRCWATAGAGRRM
jgi:hypothetical protein